MYHKIHPFKGYNTIIFTKFKVVQPLSQLNFGMFPSPKKIPTAHLQSLLVPMPNPRQLLNYFLSVIYWTFQINGFL